MSQLDNVVGVPINDPVYHFPWQVLEAIISGRSAIDLTGLRFSTPDEALDFIQAYGFDPARPDDRAELASIYEQSVRFVREVLLPFEGLNGLPEELPSDYNELLLLASTGDHPLRDWACSFLRVSHAVVHSRYTADRAFLAAARQQIFERFSTHLKVGPHGMMLSDGEMHIPLLRCDFKAEKPWESLVLKLLHKADNVAQEVYDRLGVRFVTPDKAYALLLLKYFRAHNIFAYPNIKPSRSINTLVDLDAFRREFEEIEQSYAREEISFKEFTTMVHRLGATPNADGSRNPHSGADYQAIQFTARALVRFETEGEVIRTFVPFEVQVMDEEAFASTQLGASAHEAYRSRQRQAVCQRIFPWARRDLDAGLSTRIPQELG